MTLLAGDGYKSKVTDCSASRARIAVNHNDTFARSGRGKSMRQPHNAASNYSNVKFSLHYNFPV